MGAGSWRARRRRAVSEVVATILLLAMTIVLFGSVFVFTSKLGNPTSGVSSSFTATLGYASPSSTTVTTVSITRLSGPALSGATTAQTAIYVRSQVHPSALPDPFSVAAGLTGSTTWAFGQTWTLNVASYSLSAPDNLTVSVISHGDLLFSTVLSASRTGTPPTFLSAHLTTNPTPPVHGAAFTVNVATYVDFSVPAGATVTANLTEIGGAAAQSMTNVPGTEEWTYSGSLTASTAGGFDVILTATGGTGLVSNYQVQISVS